MKVSLVCVGLLRGPLVEAIAEYEARVSRYFSFEVVEVREVPHKGQPLRQLLHEEAERLLANVPKQHEVIALHRPGRTWSSDELSAHLAEAAVRAVPGVCFLIGGAFGLADLALERATHRVSLSALTLPHELARLVLTEQLYRAGTIARGEPYHKRPLH